MIAAFVGGRFLGFNAGPHRHQHQCGEDDPVFPSSATQPYHLAVDSKHNVWGDLWTNDQIFKYDPAANKFTTFEMPIRGSEMRHLSVDEHSGVLKISMPVYRVNAMGVLTIRSDADIAKLKQQVAAK